MTKFVRADSEYTIQVVSPDGSQVPNNIVTSTANDGTVTVNIGGNLVVAGSNTSVSNTEIEDSIMLLNKNGSGADLDSGIMIDRGTNNNAVFYWNEGDDVFRAVTSTSDADATAITDTALANIRVAEPSNTSDAATKNYVDSTVGGGFSLKVAGDDSTQITVGTGNTLQFSGANGISTTGSEPDTITISLSNNLTDIHSITNSSTNADLTLSANSNGSVVIDDVLTFPANRSGEPTATAVTKVFAQTPSGGGTGVFFNNTSVNSGAAGELISKNKATALAIALG